MREIKFRAWVEGVMCYDIAEIEFTYDYIVVENHPSKIRGFGLTRATLMQYTGLKDKNGKEIYEGDVVKMHQFLFDGTEVEREHIGVVSYNDETACFVFSKIKGEFFQEYTGYDAGEGSSPICYFYGLHEESFGVIGNIYENPELLETAQKQNLTNKQ